MGHKKLQNAITYSRQRARKLASKDNHRFYSRFITDSTSLSFKHGSWTDSSIETNSTELNVPSRNIQNTQQFMEEIQKYPVLYDKFSKDFKGKYKKQNAWKSVASTFSTTPQEVEKKY